MRFEFRRRLVESCRRDCRGGTFIPLIRNEILGSIETAARDNQLTVGLTQQAPTNATTEMAGATYDDNLHRGLLIRPRSFRRVRANDSGTFLRKGL
jgi:hypothetical protein